MKNIFLAVDIGANSGRIVAGWRKGEKGIATKDVYRFPMSPVTLPDGHLAWDMDKIWENIVIGLSQAFVKHTGIRTVSVSTWGVDYALMSGEQPIPPFYCYRDWRTVKSMEELHALVPYDYCYERAGIQRSSFNTMYQLYDDVLSGRIERADSFMLLPEYLAWKLTGVFKHEYTNSTTTGLVNARTKQFDMELIRKIGLPESFFGHIHQPGEVVGDLTDALAARVRGRAKVVLCPSHDTAAAFEAAESDERSLIVTSATWSLFGIKRDTPLITEAGKAANFTNEGGVGYIRFLKNITGLWIIRRLQSEYNLTFDDTEWLARSNDFEGIINVNDPVFNAPPVMSEAITQYLAAHGGPAPRSHTDIIKCAYTSLADGYRIATEEIEKITGEKYEKLHIVGIGAKSRYLNTLAGEFTGKEIVPVPIEATAVGNLKVQIDTWERERK